MLGTAPDEQKDEDSPSLINRLIPPKWFSKVKIVVFHEYEFNVIAMIDFGVDVCHDKSIEKQFSTNGTQMKIKYDLNNAHVCHDNVCFKIPSILVKNMIDKVILGIPFINSLYPFLTEHDSITTDPFGQKGKFKFASKFEINTDDSLNLIHAKTKHLNFLKQEVRYKKIVEQLSNKLLQSKIDNFHKILINDIWSNIPNTSWHRKKHIVKTVEFCKKEIHDLLAKKLIRISKSPWSCVAFYVQKNVELKEGLLI